MEPRLPNMEEPINQRSTETTKVQNGPLRISKKYLENAYGQLKLSENTSSQFNFAINEGNMNEVYNFKTSLYVLSDIATIFWEKLEWKIEHQTPAMIEDIIVVTTRNKEKTPNKSVYNLDKL